ncbi:hypothetical protein [Nocardia sp. NPDC002869]|uniref:hypothetical protein n=1 Tax=Nocardia sp. NPDC002869 TaxID=3161032 RepID=UPI00398CE3F5
MSWQRMDGALVTVPAQVDATAHTLTVAAPAGTGPAGIPTADFAYTRPEPGILRLDGELDGGPVTIDLRATDPAAFPLNGPRFHWVQDYPGQ